MALIAAAFSFVGLMHSPSIGIFANGWALGYLVLAAIIYGAGLLAPAAASAEMAMPARPEPATPGG